MTFSTLLSRFSEVQPDGDGYVATCPAHNDSRPSLRLALTDEGKVIVKCRRGCETEQVLSAVSLSYADLFNVEPGDEVKTTSSRSGAPGPREVAALAMYLGETAERLQDGSDLSARALAYCADRFGIDTETARTLGLGVDPGGSAHAFEHLGKPYRRVPRLVVPFRDFANVPKGVQGRDLDGTDPVRWCGATNPEGIAWSRMAVFSMATGLETIVLTEGPGDALTAAGVGYDAVAIRGAAMTDLTDVMVAGLQGRRVVVAGDRDEAGQQFSQRVAQSLAGHGVQAHVLTIPSEPEDGDLSGWRAHDPEGFPDALHEALRDAPMVAASAAVAAPAPPTPAGLGADGHPLTDLGNARRLHDHLRGLVRHAPEMGFYLWDGSVWERDRFDTVRTTAHAVTDALIQEGRDTHDVEVSAGRCQPPGAACGGCTLSKWGLRSQSTRSIDAMVKELAAMPGVAVDVERMDGHADLLTFRNGTVDLRTGELRAHSPADLLTRKVDVDFNPDAKAPTWDYFLASVFPNSPALPGFMQRLVGYGITGHTREQCFAVLWGTGSNGKSVFTEALTHVFRPVTTTTPFSTFEARPSGGIPNDLAALKGARLVMASEGEQGKPMAEAIIKRVTGTDRISARFMRREFFEFTPTFLIFLATNFKPDFRGQDEGLWRRVKLIPWERYFAPHERDHYLGEKLRDEAEGIAAWAVKGAVEWHTNGLQEPESIRDATRDYRATSDALQGFLPGRIVRDGTTTLPGAEAYRLYREWCEEEGLASHEVWRRKTFYSALGERGIPRHKAREGIVLVGVRVATDADHEGDPPAPLLPPARTAPVSGANVEGEDGAGAPSLDDFLGGGA